MGLDYVVDMLLVAMLSEGHVLLEGQPGLGKTTLARTFAESIGGSFKRVQMTSSFCGTERIKTLWICVKNCGASCGMNCTWNYRKKRPKSRI